MALPSAQDARDLLEGYGITTTILSDAWIEARRDGRIVPFVEEKTGLQLSGTRQVTEYYSGNGGSVLILDHKPIVSIDEISYVQGVDVVYSVNASSIEVIREDGILKARNTLTESTVIASLFPRGMKNIRVKYTYGFADIPADLSEAVLYLMAEMALGVVANRTGGGSLSLQQINKNYGRRGKWSDIRDELSMHALSIIRKYASGVIGG